MEQGKLLKQSHKILSNTDDMLKSIELAARTCYKSEDKIKPGSDKTIVKMLVNKGHEAMIEFGWVHVHFVTNRGITHEMVRHRPCSFAQESTRYVNYNKKGMQFIEPTWWEDWDYAKRKHFLFSCKDSEMRYNALIEAGARPEQAREVLPSALKTEIHVGCNLREWKHIFNLRCNKASHPQMVALMRPVLKEFHERIPVIFDDLYEKYIK